MEIDWVALAGIGGTFFGGVFGAGFAFFQTRLTVISERSKYAREKLWDMRRVAYSELIQLTAKCKYHASMAAFLADIEDRQEQIDEAYRGFNELRRAGDALYLDMSENFNALFTNLIQEILALECEKDDKNYYQQMTNALSRNLIELRRIAQQDLAPAEEHPKELWWHRSR